ncbi:alpha/beta fold hydrolase [Sphingomonas dokdonensis]|uniref:Putative aminoacrylate hydrolase RutD n=1 Tax=Sphingomonas dokdonensis TaxID=344880 RepID=A0A245ZTV6_9SPHN|nr:alpha/beta hydrolase [Sphingomonas dokdonensis]OWK33150.1 putative aminoacrylate hydrolase RutD [Sphingomonas dokdonensis]
MRIMLAVLAMCIAPAAHAQAGCTAAPRGATVDAGRGVVISVRTVGAGRPLVMLPSLARGSADFDEVAGRLASRGFMTILPEPRGINGSSGPAPKDLFDLAEDVAAVINKLCRGRVDLVGHAFGNRVARAFATAHSQMVHRLGLLAGGGEVPLTPDISAALSDSVAMGKTPDAARLAALQLAFFAKGSDPSRWLAGWYPHILQQQSFAVRHTPAERWWKGGGVPTLLIQADEDPIAPAANAAALKRDIGDKLTLITLSHASHAILPEQPEAVSEALAGYFAQHMDTPTLQQVVDRATYGKGVQP